MYFEPGKQLNLTMHLVERTDSVSTPFRLAGKSKLQMFRDTPQVQGLVSLPQVYMVRRDPVKTLLCCPRQDLTMDHIL